MLPNPRVLIVEDETIVQLHLRTILKELGYVVSGVATTAAEALVSAAADTPDLVLMDIQLPEGRDGIEAARELQKRYNLAVVFLTAYADEETVERTEEIGAVGYIVKPFGKAQIRAALSTAFAEHRKLKRTRENEHSLASVLGSMGDALILTDMEGVVTFLNPQASTLTGWSQGEALNKHLLEVVRISGLSRAAAFERLLAKPLEESTAASIDNLDLVASDGTERSVQGEIKPLTDTDGTKGGLLVAFREISGRPKEKTAPARAGSWRFGAETRMAIYSHDTFGLGHLQRSLNISRVLVDRFPGLSVLIITGSPAVHRYPLPEGVDYVKLPAVRKVAPERYEARSLGLSYEGMFSLRTNLALQSIRDYDPHVLLVDHAPVGMRGEILPALEWLHKNHPSCIKMIGLRDIVDDPDTVMDLWKRQGIYQILRKFYDHILVYGSPEVFDPVSAYRFPPDLQSKVFCCNYIREVQPVGGGPEPESVPTGEKPFVLVTIGGGDGAGEVVIGSYLKMLRCFESEVSFESIILTGPFLPPELLGRFREEIKGLPARLLDFVLSTSPYMNRSDLIVSTGGYNTITQALCFGKKALVIPRVMHRKEQLLRARRLAEMGLVTFLHPDDVTPERLYESVNALLADPAQPLAEARARTLVRFDGTDRLADFCGRLRYPESPAKEAQDD